MGEDVIKTNFEKNMLNMSAFEDRFIVRPIISKFNGLDFAKMLGMPRKLLDDLEKSKEDVFIDWNDNYGFFGLEINIYTKYHSITFEIPFAKDVTIDVSDVPETVKEDVKRIINKVVKSAKVWTETPVELRVEVARMVMAEAYNSLKRLKED